tara:strand:- start:239 stop:490 length:252 start_codon:yes stop_codon:yes gene_type:complete
MRAGLEGSEMAVMAVQLEGTTPSQLGGASEGAALRPAATGAGKMTGVFHVETAVLAATVAAPLATGKKNGMGCGGGAVPPAAG